MSRGAAPSVYASIPVTVKDLFDIEGQVTTAGSRVLAGETPASRDAVAVAQLRQAGFIVIGRASMTEFAYSGLGMNPHYGNPLSPWNFGGVRVSGGSTSGGAVAIRENRAHASLETDTDGAFPLSTTLDSIGPIARSVDCCSMIDAVISGQAPFPTA